MSYPTLVQPEKPAPAPSEPEPEAQAVESELLRDVASRLMLYVSWEATQQLKELAMKMSGRKATVRVHDLCLEGLEMLFKKYGLPGPVRAKEPLQSQPKTSRRQAS